MTEPSLVIADKIFTADPSSPVVNWMLIAGGKVVVTGTGDPPDVREKTRFPFVLPGLIDAHVHLTTTGLYGTGLDFRDCRSVSDLLGLLETHIRGNQSRWIIGGNFDPGRNAEGRMPTRYELDKVAADRLLLVSRADGHSCVLNSRGFEEANIDPSTSGIAVDEQGVPTGVLAHSANYEARRRFFSLLDEIEIVRAQTAACRIALSRGVTALHEMAGGTFMGDKDYETLMANRASYPVDVLPYLATLDVAKPITDGLSTIGGDLFLDGSIGSKTAAMSEPYESDVTRGHLYHSSEEITGFFVEASRAGLQAGVHAIGDEAIEQAISCIEDAFITLGPEGAVGARRLGHRIEHLECVSGAQIERARSLGLTASVQPMFDAYWGGPDGMYTQRLGERARTMNPFLAMVDAGLVVAGGSDSTVTPLDPFLGMSAAMGHSDESQRVDFQTALAMFSRHAAIAGHQQAERGSLSAGKMADLCVVERDPSLCSPEDLSGMEVLDTWVAGTPAGLH